MTRPRRPRAIDDYPMRGVAMQRCNLIPQHRAWRARIGELLGTDTDLETGSRKRALLASSWGRNAAAPAPLYTPTALAAGFAAIVLSHSVNFALWLAFALATAGEPVWAPREVGIFGI
ncbi:hypothetical protein DFJ74DRAFT_767364 [Hyaloraphidium curvatum]|nr:hypothetical protein DFJ74DRAFT_767364 [Hyaloraphidium curvatum]